MYNIVREVKLCRPAEFPEMKNLLRHFCPGHFSGKYSKDLKILQKVFSSNNTEEWTEHT